MRDAEKVPTRPDRYEELYRSSYQEIFAYVLRRTSAGSDSVPDLVAEVFVVAWRRRDALPESPQDRLWLFGVARRVLLEQQRRQARQLRLESRLRDQAATGLAAAPGDSARWRLRSGLALLSPGDREALLLVAWDGLSHAEAAQVLGCSVNAVALRVHKARRRLRDALSPVRTELPASAPDGGPDLPASSRSAL